MSKIFCIALLSMLLLVACSKEGNVSKKLNGSWELAQYKLTLLDGISEYAVCDGQLKIEPSETLDWNNAFELSINFDFPSVSGSSSEKGFYRIRQKGEFLDASYRDSNNLETHLLDYRIMVLNRSDLQLEFRDTNGRINYLTFRRLN